MRHVAEVAEGRGEPAAVLRRRIAVLVPCYNEGAAIAPVEEHCRACLPGAPI